MNDDSILLTRRPRRASTRRARTAVAISHGVPNWPDPTNDGGRVRFEVFDASVPGLDPNSPQVMATVHKCQSLLHSDIEAIGMG